MLLDFMLQKRGILEGWDVVFVDGGTGKGTFEM